MAFEQSSTDQGRKHNVITKFNYWDSEADGGKPRAIFIGKNSVTNERPHRAHEYTVTDVSGDEDQYTLDANGFQYHQHVSKEKDFVDETKIETEYYPECEQLIKDVTGAKRVHIFNHKVRRGPTHWRHLGRNNLDGVRGPVARAHVDQSYAGAELRLRWEFPDEADELLKHRYQIINIWRPIKLIERDPIGVADSSSVTDADLIGAPLIEDNFQGENWTVRHNPSHRWHFKHHLSPEEVLLIKCFDSEQSVARRALHSAFEDPAYLDEDNRQSIEVRCLVLYDD
jgi:hypothetical protein